MLAHMNKPEANELLEWYDRHQRHLPWRTNQDPYRVWVSEIMLQQTRVETVLTYYELFLTAFPTVFDLANASLDQVLKQWEGLGYYRRARQLHAAAILVVEQDQGTFPQTVEEWKKLPGIGDYTAGAIASIAFDEKAYAIDGNVMRVASRMSASYWSPRPAKAIREVKEWLEPIVPLTRRGDFNQALMELGATVCLPHGAPQCLGCPWRNHCQAYAAGNPLAYPQKVIKKSRPCQSQQVFMLHDQGRLALVQRTEKGLLEGLWQFPMREATPEASSRAWLQSQGVFPVSLQEVGHYRHIFSHLEWDLTVYEAELKNAVSNTFIWKTVAEIRAEYPLPKAFQTALSLFETR